MDPLFKRSTFVATLTEIEVLIEEAIEASVNDKLW